jgi:hypothetical protein
MVLARMMLCVVVAEVGVARSPIDTEMFLGDAVANPVEPHIYCLGATLLDGVVGDADGSGVVGCHGSGFEWGAAHFGQCCVKNFSFLAVME